MHVNSLRKSARLAAVAFAILCGPLAVLLMGQTQPGLFLPNTFCGGTSTSPVGTPTAALCVIRTLVGADLPKPTGTTLGGIEAFTPVTHQWINGITLSGTPTAAQPNYTDIAGVLPNPGPTTLGGIESYTPVTHQWINGITTSGTPTSTQPAFTDISGVITPAQCPNATSVATGCVEPDNSTITVAGGIISASLAAAKITNSLSGDVNLSNTGSYFNGPSVAQGGTGVWFASGTVTLTDTASAFFLCQLWDGTTTISSAKSWIPATGFTTITLSGYLASPAGNLTIRCNDPTTVNGKILFNATGTSKDSTLSAFRIQ
jgi:hypothetical protein